MASPPLPVLRGVRRQLVRLHRALPEGDYLTSEKCDRARSVRLSNIEQPPAIGAGTVERKWPFGVPNGGNPKSKSQTIGRADSMAWGVK